jgi:hypothetical protein
MLQLLPTTYSCNCTVVKRYIAYTRVRGAPHASGPEVHRILLQNPYWLDRRKKNTGRHIEWRQQKKKWHILSTVSTSICISFHIRLVRLHLKHARDRSLFSTSISNSGTSIVTFNACAHVGGCQWVKYICKSVTVKPALLCPRTPFFNPASYRLATPKELTLFLCNEQ